MCKECDYKLIAKVQHFSDRLKQVILEKESLVIITGKQSKEMKKEIHVYQEISNDYDENFKNIVAL